MRFAGGGEKYLEAAEVPLGLLAERSLAAFERKLGCGDVKSSSHSNAPPVKQIKRFKGLEFSMKFTNHPWLFDGSVERKSVKIQLFGF